MPSRARRSPERLQELGVRPRMIVRATNVQA